MKLQHLLLITMFGLLLTGFGACGGGSGSSATVQGAVTLSDILSTPWGVTFLPDNRILITERSGDMVILSADGKTKLATVSGLPTVNTICPPKQLPEVATSHGRGRHQHNNTGRQAIGRCKQFC